MRILSAIKRVPTIVMVTALATLSISSAVAKSGATEAPRAITAAATVSGVTTAATWHTIASETFEGVFPEAGWTVYDYNGASVGGSFVWDDTNGGYHSDWAAHPADGVSPYPINIYTGMLYGPFSLAGATNGTVTFKYTLDTEAGFDFFGYGYSCDGGSKWTDTSLSGYQSGWKTATLSLKKCKGKTAVFVRWTFFSDPSFGTSGARVDNITIKKYS